MTVPSLPPRTLWLLLLAAILIWFGNLDYRHLVKPDEGRYAEIPREMVASSDWLTPRLNGLKYFEKPALQYWATAAAYTLFGEHHWTARLWSALTGLLGVVLIWFAGRRIYGEQTGLYAALVLGSSLLYELIAHINTLDMGVTFFMSLGMAGFMLAQLPSTTRSQNAFWMHVTWAALALSVLSKGLIGLVLPGAVLVLYTLLQRDWVLWKRLHMLSGITLFLLLSAPWFIAVSLANPEFFHFFFIHEHFERFLTKVHGRYHPWWTFIPILLLGMLPWVALLPEALARARKKDFQEHQAFQPSRFLLIWAVFIFVFFSVSDSKLPSYILPIFPALALLIGHSLTRLSGMALFWRIAPMAVLALTGLWLTPEMLSMSDEVVPRELYVTYLPWVIAAAAIWLLGVLASLYFSYRNKAQRTIITLALSSLVAAQILLSGHESLAPSNSSNLIAQKIKPYVKPGIPFYSVGMYDQTLPFYLKRTFTLVAYQDELEFGIAQEPQKWLSTNAAFTQAWKRDKEALAIMTPADYNQLLKDGLPMQIIASDTRRIVVKKP